MDHVVALHEKGFEDLVPEGVFESLLAAPIRVFRVPDPLPRVYGTTGVRVAAELDMPAVLLGPDFDLRREVVLAEGESRSPSAGPAHCRLLAFGADRIEAEVDMPTPGHLVVLDTFEAGWRATVDGGAAPVLLANGAFRAVPVPAGRHRVRLAYRPRSVTVGVTLSVLSLAVLIGLLVATRFRSSQAPGLVGFDSPEK